MQFNMDNCIALLYSKTKLCLLYQFMTRVENLLKTNMGKVSEEMHKTSEESAVLIDIEYLLKDLDKICELKDSLQGKYIVEEFRKQVDDANSQLKSAIRIFKASINKFSLNFMSEAVRELVAVDVKFLLESVVTFLVIVQEIEEKILENISSYFKSLLSLLHKYIGMEKYKDEYKKLIFSLQDFIAIMQHLVKDVISKERQCKLIITLTEFKRLFIIFYEIQSITYSHVNLRKNFSIWKYIVIKMNYHIEKIIQFSKCNNINEENHKEIGYLVKKIDEFLHHLSSMNNIKIHNKKLEQLFKEILQYCLTVSDLMINEDNDVRKICNRALLQYNVCKNIEKKLENNINDLKIKHSLVLETEVLLDDIYCLESQINIEILKLLGEKLPRLQAIFEINMDHITYLKNKEKSEVNVDLMFREFYEQADLVYQICRFAVGCSTNIYIVYRILVIVEQLGNLNPDLSSVIHAFCLEKDDENLNNLKFIKNEWDHYINELIHNIMKIIDPKTFLRILRIQIEKECNKDLDPKSVPIEIKYIITSLELFIITVSLNEKTLWPTETEENPLQKIIEELRIVSSAITVLNENEENQKNFKQKSINILQCIDDIFSLMDTFNNSSDLSEDKNSAANKSNFLSNDNRSSIDRDSFGKNGNKINVKQTSLSDDNILQIDITDILENLVSLPANFSYEELNTSVEKNFSGCLENMHTLSEEKCRLNKDGFHCTDFKTSAFESIDVSKGNASENTSLTLEESVSFDKRIKTGNQSSQNTFDKTLQAISITTKFFNIRLNNVDDDDDEIINILKSVSQLLSNLIKEDYYKDAIFSTAKILTSKTEALLEIISKISCNSENKKATKELQSLSEQLHLSSIQIYVLSNIETEIQNDKKYGALFSNIAKLLNKIIQTVFRMNLFNKRNLRSPRCDIIQ